MGTAGYTGEAAGVFDWLFCPGPEKPLVGMERVPVGNQDGPQDMYPSDLSSQLQDTPSVSNICW
jgi:hypothetical protein